MGWLDKQERKNPETGTKEMYWSIQDRNQGQKIKKALGFITEKEAQQLLKIYEGDKARGLNHIEVAPQNSASASKRCPTLYDWWGDISEPWPAQPDCRMKQWLIASGFQPKTIRMYDTSRRIFLPILGELPLKDIGPAEGDRVIVWMRKQEYLPRTIQIIIDHLQRGLRVAHEDGVLASLPRLRRPKLTEIKERKFLTPEETTRLLGVLENRSQQGIIGTGSVLAILLAVNLGLRSGEVLSRRWEDIDWKASTINIGQVKIGDKLWKPKTKESIRTMPVPASLMTRLREAWLQTGRKPGWIFPAEGNSDQPQGSFKRGLATACRAAGVPELHPHALRHTAATRWMWAGMDRPTAMRLGGWKSSKMLDEVYAHSNHQRAADLLEASSVEACCPTNLPHNPKMRKAHS